MDADVLEREDITLVCAGCGAEYLTVDGRKPGTHMNKGCPICPSTPATVIKVLPDKRFSIKQAEGSDKYKVYIEAQSIVERTYEIYADNKKEAEIMAEAMFRGEKEDIIGKEFYKFLDLNIVDVENA